jgi:IS4 transposase
MNSGQYVFSQIVSFMSVYEFNKCAERYHGNKNVRELNCWNQFLQLFFGQLTGRNGLRDIHTCLKAHQSNLYHLGIRQLSSFSSLARANENRDSRIFSDFGQHLIKRVSALYFKDKRRDFEVENPIFALDSTTISVSIKLWKWARGKYSKGAVKVHALMDLYDNIPTFIHITDGKTHDVNTLDLIDITTAAIYVMDRAYIDFSRLFLVDQAQSYFIVRAKNNLHFEIFDTMPVDTVKTDVLEDQEILLKGIKSKTAYPKILRRIAYYDKEKKKTFIFLTNNFYERAEVIAEIYRNRWQIEVFFKWIKQNLQIKTLWGHSENAVKTHIWVAICTYLVVAQIKKQLKSHLSIYEMMQIFSVSCFSKTPLTQLLSEPIPKQNVNELNLFNFS